MQIFDFVSAGKLKKLLQQYSEAFHTAILFLNGEKEVILRFPEAASHEDLVMKPLNLKDSLLGYIAIPSTPAAEAYLDFIEQNLSGMIEMGFEIESLSREVAKNYEEISLLWRLSSRLGAGLNVENICKTLADEVMNICPSRNISVMLASDISSNTLTSLSPVQGSESDQSDNKPLLFPEVSLGADAHIASRMTLSKDDGLIGYIFKKKEPLTICDVQSDRRYKALPYQVKSLLIVPLIVEDLAIGAIIASDKLNGEEFYSTEIRLISSLSSECSISIKKALLFDEIHNMLFSTAEAFSLAIDAKDSYTYGHSKRVSEIAVHIARNMNLPPDALDWIRLAALLHDIGKIGTPEVILHKIEKLTPDEMNRVREHPLVGAKMIEHIERLKEIALWICHHHERYDGSGYPSGIVGKEIPLPSRIISFADAFDALTSDRPYRKAFTKEEAIRIIKESVGAHFDPVLFEYFEKAVS